MKVFEILREVKQAIREPYAWPGGYPKYIVTRDGEAMSVESAKANWPEICKSTMFAGYSGDGWAASCVDINWEDPALYCCHSGKRIESAYAEDEVENWPQLDHDA